MTTKYLLGVLALTMSTAAFAADPAPTPKKECCCDKGADGKKCCDKVKDGKAGNADHADHDMSGMDHK